jgi:S-adenosylmethionine:tRNA ribosyltransferase-isomerase
VVRALEHAATPDGVVQAGDGVANQRIDHATELRVVDAILTGTHEAGTSHHDLLAAFVSVETLARIDWELAARDYRTHEFGDSVFLEKEAVRKIQWVRWVRMIQNSNPLNLSTLYSR